MMFEIPRSMMDNFSFEPSSIKSSASQPSEMAPQVKTRADGSYNMVTIILPSMEKEKIQLVLSQNAVSIK